MSPYRLQATLTHTSDCSTIWGKGGLCICFARAARVQSRIPDPRAGVVTRTLVSVQKCLCDMSDRTSV